MMAADANRTAHILLDGAQEILGSETLQEILERIALHDRPWGSASPGQPATRLPLGDSGPFLRALEERYGEPGGRGLALRIGRATFRYGLKTFGDQAGFRAMEFRLMPAPRRLENGLNALAGLVAEEFSCSVTVSDEDACWVWRMAGGPPAADPRGGAQAADRHCFLIAGMLQEFMAWAGGGRFYSIVETECRAAGSPACVYRIEKKPLD